jgi:hypothetical protein
MDSMKGVNMPQTAPQSEKLDFDEVWLMFQETDRQMKETDRQMKATDKKLKELDRLFIGQWG